MEISFWDRGDDTMDVKSKKRRIYKHYNKDRQVVLFEGDCKSLFNELPDGSVDLIITSPPYCMGKAYENPKNDIDTFKKQHEEIFDDLYRVLKKGGSMCWQVGYHVSEACIVPLDILVYNLFTELSKQKDIPLILRNRIVWTFGHGLNSTKRFSGRHEMILWFTKGDEGCFNLDEVRIPQKYPGKKYYRGKHKGEYSGNPLGKNPSDVWDIPNVKANHVEKTIHPCQFPVAIPDRLIKALSPEDGLVLDPFMGAGTTGVAAIMEKRRFAGAENVKEYYDVSRSRIHDALTGDVKIREDKAVEKPNKKMSVAKLPEEFKEARKVKWHENNK